MNNPLNSLKKDTTAQTGAEALYKYINIVKLRFTQVIQIILEGADEVD
ncbi:MAG: hypothetical protein AAGE59_00375 [Cyanobacteria bacterium P01_F01_bin.86]